MIFLLGFMMFSRCEDVFGFMIYDVFAFLESAINLASDDGQNYHVVMIQNRRLSRK